MCYNKYAAGLSYAPSTRDNAGSRLGNDRLAFQICANLLRISDQRCIMTVKHLLTPVHCFAPGLMRAWAGSVNPSPATILERDTFLLTKSLHLAVTEGVMRDAVDYIVRFRSAGPVESSRIFWCGPCRCMKVNEHAKTTENRRRWKPPNDIAIRGWRISLPGAFANVGFTWRLEALGQWH